MIMVKNEYFAWLKYREINSDTKVTYLENEMYLFLFLKPFWKVRNTSLKKRYLAVMYLFLKVAFKYTLLKFVFCTK